MKSTDINNERGAVYRNWKGYLVWAEPCRSADTGKPGRLIQILTGPRVGEREWRSKRDWDSEPHGVEGLPRYEEFVGSTWLDPLAMAMAVYRAAYPEAPTIPIYWDPEHDTPGACYYAPDGRAQAVCIRTDLTIEQAIGVLLHELAHVVVGPAEENDDEHGPLWQAAYDALITAYAQRLEALGKIRGVRIYNHDRKTTAQTATSGRSL